MSKIEIRELGEASGQIILDGHDIGAAVSGVDIRSHIGDVPMVTLHLPITKLDGSTIDDTRVHMPLSTYNLLRRAGWKPPASSEWTEIAFTEESR